ncbi:Eukaryotic translation initiation factor 2-alpha kinase, partial [Rhizopus stolonifer]
FMDEMTNISSTFQQAFHKLFFTAVQTVRNQDLLQFNDPLPSKDSNDYFTIQKKEPIQMMNLHIQNSRYNTDFIELNLLGKGGFASAFRARNKLDGIDYAVKKIRLSNDIQDEQQDDAYERIFREIKNLARLEHQNVIRYYASWLEFDESTDSEEEESVFPEPSFDSTPSDITEASSLRLNDTSYIQFGEASSLRQEDTSYIQFGEESYLQSSSIESTTPSTSETMKKTGWILFIQMQLCPTTLHDYIRFRNKQYADDDSLTIDAKRNLEIFSQILQGTAYIHQQGLIHRDLKPSNIFLFAMDKRMRKQSFESSCSVSPDSAFESDLESIPLWEGCWVPKIGDFGLAAEAMDEQGESVLVPTPISSTPPSPRCQPTQRPKPKRTRTIGVGTRTYASPEQLAAQNYDEKVDIYSLGIILFELFQPFSTGMERAEALDKLKRGVFPEGFLDLYPKVTALILWMMDMDPSHRPSAHQLLQFELFVDHPHQVDSKKQMQVKINQLERKNKQLKQRVHEQEKAMKEMEQKLQAMQLLLNEPKPKKQVRWI